MTTITHPRDTPTPHDLGAPDQFTGWHPYQYRIWEWGWYAMDDHRHVGIPAGTGSGKSMIAYLLARNSGKRCVILTSRKGLQDQYTRDFPEITDIRGWRNYPRWEDYDAQRQEAELARVVVTSYAYWIYGSKFGQGIGDREVVILDESHDCFPQLSNFLDVSLEPRMLTKWRIRWPGNELGDEIGKWREWSDQASRVLAEMLRGLRYLLGRDRSDEGRVLAGKWFPNDRRETTKYEKSDLEELQHLSGRIAIIAESVGEWLVDVEPYHARLVKVWPAEDAERYLFRGARHVFWLSATLTPKIMEICGADSDIAFQEWPHPFHPRNRPVYWIPTIRAIQSRATEEDWKYWLMRIDQLITRGGDDSLGIVNTVSYNRAQMVMSESKYAGTDRLITHKPDETAEAVEDFLGFDPPAALVSPVLIAGWDLGRVAYSVVGKIPFRAPDLPTKRRREIDPDLGIHEAIQDIVQVCGRITRSPDPRTPEGFGETFIIDDQIGWVMAVARKKRLVPRWFNVQRVSSIPPRRSPRRTI